MTIRHLEIFICVAECGKMSHAAKKLYIAQPTVSQAIKEIEKQYDVMLFDRLGGKLYLTACGHQLLEYARHIISLMGEMESQVLAAKAGMEIKLGASITVATCVLTSILEKYEKQNPSCNVKVVVDNTSIAEKMLLEDKLDLALVEGKISNKVLKCLPVMEDELVLIAGKSHPFSQLTKIDITQLEGQALVCREKGSGTRALFESYLLQQQVHIHEKWTCNNSEAIKNAVIAGQGLAVISRLLAQTEIQAGMLFPVALNNIRMKRQFMLVYHRNKYLSPAMQSFISLCKNLKQ